MTCGKLLAPGQWWHFCGETDMGQTLPVQCETCGGQYKLAAPEVQARYEIDRAKRIAELEEVQNTDKSFPTTYSGNGSAYSVPSSISLTSKDVVIWIKKKIILQGELK